MNESSYTIVTPAHNEERFLPRVIETIAGQSLLPLRWVLLDDRSTDDTWRVISAAAERHPFIEPLRVSGEPCRQLGANVVRLFNMGCARVAGKSAFIVKMDADVVLPPSYFETLLERFLEDPRLGIASGKTYTSAGGHWVLERIPDTHVTGACKTYRTTCLQDMGGVIPILGWDILDGVQARRKGWRTRSFRDLSIQHLRMTGAATGMAAANLRYGACYYVIRAHPLFVLAKTFYRALEHPYFASAFIPIGYLKATLAKEPRLEDRDLARALRREQVARLLGHHLDDEEWLPRRLEVGRDDEKVHDG
jgi:glycosyltransferase involved in cell wall biosynthesis